MTIIDFAEKVCGCKLLPYQKELLKKLETLPRGCKIVMGPKGRIYIIEKEIEKMNDSSRGTRLTKCDTCLFEGRCHGEYDVRDYNIECLDFIDRQRLQDAIDYIRKHLTTLHADPDIYENGICNVIWALEDVAIPLIEKEIEK